MINREDRDLAFHEQWFPEGKKSRLREVFELVPDITGDLVEIGAWEGRSTILTAQSFPTSSLYVVDHWKGAPADPRSKTAKLAKKRNVFGDFMENIEAAGVAERIVVRRGDWREQFAGWNRPIRFLFLDAGHTYTEVADNLREALRWMAPGAVIAGDDFEQWTDVRDAVFDVLGQVGNRKGPEKAGEIWWWVNDPDWRPR